MIECYSMRTIIVSGFNKSKRKKDNVISKCKVIFTAGNIR